MHWLGVGRPQVDACDGQIVGNLRITVDVGDDVQLVL
jgi:hypothetical protein